MNAVVTDENVPIVANDVVRLSTKIYTEWIGGNRR